MDSKGKIVTADIPEENKAWYCLDSRSPDQCYWYVGISAALLLHCHELTGNKRYLKNAVKNLDFLQTCGQAAENSFASGKYGYASALAYRATGEDKYKQIALRHCDWVVSQQEPNGRWSIGGDELAWYLQWDLTGEFAYWLREITAIISSPKKLHIK